MDIYGIHIYILVGGLEHDWIMTFHSVGNFIIPTDTNSIIFQRGGPTTNQYNNDMKIMHYSNDMD